MQTTIIIKVDNSIIDNFLWLLKLFSKDEVVILEQSDRDNLLSLSEAKEYYKKLQEEWENFF